MDAMLVAKEKPEVAEESQKRVTTWKAHRDTTARMLRLIGAYLDLNQEETLALFDRDIENMLATLQAKEQEKRKRKAD